MPTYDYSCPCGRVTEFKAGYEVTTISCPACGSTAPRVAVYMEQSIRGDTVPKGIATRRGNIKDKNDRYRVSLFQEASEEVAHDDAKREYHGLPKAPNLYKAGVAEARRRGAAIRGN